MFYVFGDYGYKSECELYGHKNLEYAKRWAEGYTRYNDLGGYAVVEVASFSEKGEYQVHWVRSEEGEPDWGRNWYDTGKELA
jgi:hypothetical protein